MIQDKPDRFLDQFPTFKQKNSSDAVVRLSYYGFVATPVIMRSAILINPDSKHGIKELLQR